MAFVRVKGVVPSFCLYIMNTMFQILHSEFVVAGDLCNEHKTGRVTDPFILYNAFENEVTLWNRRWVLSSTKLHLIKLLRTKNQNTFLKRKMVKTGICFDRVGMGPWG